MTQPTIFISYSRKDEKEKDRLLSHLRVLQDQELIEVWSDDRIGAGADWEQEISKAMTQARMAILLISANFLTSDFILRKEAPILLQRRKSQGLTILPVIIRPCTWKKVDWLAEMNVRPKNGKAIWGTNNRRIDEDLAAIVDEVVAIIKSSPPITSTASGVHRQSERAENSEGQISNSGEIKEDESTVINSIPYSALSPVPALSQTLISSSINLQQHSPSTRLKGLTDYIHDLGWQKLSAFVITVVALFSFYYIFYVRQDSTTSLTPTPIVAPTDTNSQAIVVTTDRVETETSQLSNQFSNITAPESTATYNVPTKTSVSTKLPTDVLTVGPSSTPTHPSPTNTPTGVLSISTSEITPTSVIASLIVNISALNVRSGPGKQYNLIGQLRQGDQVEIIGQGYGTEGQWWQINFPSSPNGLAWISGDPELVTVLNSSIVPIVTVPPLPTATPTPLLTKTPPVSTTMSTSVPPPQLIEYNGKDFIWKWDGLNTVGNENWYFDIKIYESANGGLPYEVIVADPQATQYIDGKWHFSGATNFRNCSYWAVQIARGKPPDLYEGAFSPESNRLLIKCGSNGGNDGGGGGGGGGI